MGDLVQHCDPDLAFELAHYFGIDETKLDELGYA